MYSYAHANVASLPHQSESQRLMFRQIPRSAALPGDLIFYGQPAYHVAIYAGGNMQYSATDPAEGVRYQAIYSSDVTFGTIWH